VIGRNLLSLANPGKQESLPYLGELWARPAPTACPPVGLPLNGPISCQVHMASVWQCCHTQFGACDMADVAKSTFLAITREVLLATAEGLPPVRFRMSCSAQESSAADFVEQLGGRIAGMVAVLDGTRILIRMPPAA